MTAQVREKIYINGKEERMAAEPLAPYLFLNPHIKFEYPHTACWRGYFGTWLLEDDKLYLTEFYGNLEGPNNTTISVDLQYLFPGQEKVFAQWYSGTVKIEKGERLKYVHSGYSSIYETNLFLVFEEGVKIDEYSKDNTIA